MTGLLPSRALRRAAFLLYIPALFIATHWPNLRIEGPVDRPDIYIHIAAFGLWSALLIAAAFFGPALSARNILASVLLAAFYAAFDESTQAIPILHRTAAWDDFFADLGGVLAAGIGAGVFSALIHARAARSRHPTEHDDA